MLDCIIDALLDSIKLLPYLFITFVILEFIEHKLTEKREKLLIKYKEAGPILGGLLGGFPQCGFSTMASSLFSSKVITMGTVVAVFLSTSDEMLPIMLGEKVELSLILKIILFKIVVGVIIGLAVDFIFRNKENHTKHEQKNQNDESGNHERHEHHEHIAIEKMCEDENCHCENGIFKSSLKHTFSTAVYVLIANILINVILFFIGLENLENVLNGNKILTHFISSLIGLIPNCAASIVITKVYLSDLISIGTAISGLLTGSGIGILLLFKSNKSLKENLSILSIIYFSGVIVGILVDFIL